MSSHFHFYTLYRLISSPPSKNSKERQKFLFLILDRSGNAIERNPFEIIDDPFFFYPLRGELKGICARSTTHFSPPPRKSLDDQASQTSPSLAIIIIITIIIPSSRKMGEKKGARNVGAERERSGIKETGEGRSAPIQLRIGRGLFLRVEFYRFDEIPPVPPPSIKLSIRQQ